MRAFVFTDIHGKMELYKQIKDFLSTVKGEYCVYFLGDACDRGTMGIEIMTDMLNDEHFVYFRGNHEVMFVNAARSIWETAQECGCSSVWEYWDRVCERDYNNIVKVGDISFHSANGGDQTLITWLSRGGSMNFVNKIATLPVHEHVVVYDKDYHLMHAGCHHNFLFDTPNEDEMIWSRSHFYHCWPHGTLIHGHTPVQLMPSFEDPFDGTPIRAAVPLTYAWGSKINLDTGAYSSGHIYLMELGVDKFYHFETPWAENLEE